MLLFTSKCDTMVVYKSVISNKTKMDEQKKRMAGMANDGATRPFKYVVPMLRFNGNTGDFRKVVLVDKGEPIETPITKPVSLVILKKRRIVSSYDANASYFTQEHNSVNDKLLLYKNIGGSISFDAIGYGPELKAKNQKLKTQEIIYALYEGEVHKLTVKGSSMMSYYDYLKALSADDLHSFEVTTIINTKKMKNESLGTWYHTMEFSRGAVVTNLDEVEAAMKTVHDNTQKMDQYSAQELLKRSGGVKTAPAPVKDDFDGFKTYPKDDINPEDIPF